MSDAPPAREGLESLQESPTKSRRGRQRDDAAVEGVAAQTRSALRQGLAQAWRWRLFVNVTEVVR